MLGGKKYCLAGILRGLKFGGTPAWLPFPVVHWRWTFGCFSKLVLKSTEACWVLAEICPCQTWHVSWCLAVTITKSPRGSPLKEAERDYDSFSSFTFELANTKGEGSMWAGSRAGSKKLGCTNDLKHQMWTNFILDGWCSCDALFQHCVEQADFVSSELTPFVLYPVNSLQVHNLQFTACCFLFPHSKPWWGGGCNKTPQVLTAELIRWQNDSIWFSPCYCLFHCAFGDFPAWEMLFVIGCAK